ncbi:arylsulfatase [Algibacter mikhailovii]|uniref:arylsulfatase n=1 Tax=Algibacter mikhailovii TaxID=425498 RepID=UPI0024955C15|nr:arylsulfatase [Algibacter mikhailovii]
MKRHSLLILLVFVLLTCSCKQEKKTVVVPKKKPNIIYILADDLGYGDLGCYGQEKIQTPHIDKLAAEGIRFTQHYSGSTVCAPSRSALMTGQHTGHTPIRGNKELKGQEGQTPLPHASVTIAEVLKKAGYVTGGFGKWGLGFIGSEGDPNNQGFDEFYGYNCQRMAHRYYPPYLWRNREKDSLKGNNWIDTVTYAPDKIQEETLQFIEKNKNKPFFAYVPIVLPHAELISPNDSILAKYIGEFRETPFKNAKSSDYGPNLIISRYCSQETPYAVFAAMISRTDAYVGQIIEKLKTLGLDENTIVMFSSDNGPHEVGGADPYFFNSSGGLKGVKRDLYEGGIRVPFIVKWPKKINPGTTSNHASAFWDILPTLAELVGDQTVIKSSDGISLWPTLLEEGEQQQHGYLYWEFSAKGGRKAVRKGNWKGVCYDIHKNGYDNFELYDLSIDALETQNLAEQHPDIVVALKALMNSSRTESSLFPFK